MKLAINGGKPVIRTPYLRYCSIGREEELAAGEVMKGGCLSAFYGSNHPNFYGGDKVLDFEKQWSDYFDVDYAVSLNSATSGLYAAVGSLGIGPGDEVIVPPYTMSASVSSVLLYNAIPVFADIEDETFGLDPNSVEKLITDRTKAIIVVHLFGHPAKMIDLMAIANKYNLYVIEDCAQSPGAIYYGQNVGTIGNIGVFSLNCHKVINSGEGGVCVTNDEELKMRISLIRNHAEAVIGGGMNVSSLVNMLGFNFRMGEIEASIGIEQIKKLKSLNDYRNDLCLYLSDKLKNLEGITPPAVLDNCSHVWYTYSPQVDESVVGISRNLFVQALAKEGAPFYPGYCLPLYLLPIFQRKIVFGSQGCPFSCELNRDLLQQYDLGICPTCEHVEYHSLIQSEQIRPPLNTGDMDDIYAAFCKVLDNINELKNVSPVDQKSMPTDPASRRLFFRNS